MSKKIFTLMHGKKVKSPLKWTNLAIYGSSLLLLIVVAAVGYRSPVNSVAGQQSNRNAVSSVESAANVPIISDIEAISYADSTASKTNLAVAPNISEQKASTEILAVASQSTVTSVSKTPTITDTEGIASLSSYTAVEGDNTTTIADKFGISDQTVRWANGLKNTSVEVGKELTIPIVDGVVYTVKGGDTLASVSEKYKSDKEQIITINNLDGENISVGMRLVLPSGELPETERPDSVAPVVIRRPVYSSSSRQMVGTGGSRAPNAPLAAGNTFYYGNCTWYAYNRRIQMWRNMGGIRGNANAWDNSARSAGYAVNNTPEVGAIMQTDYGRYGHVSVVEAINADGSVLISEMNNRALGGFGIANYNTITNPYDYTYIH
ncbi:MAG: LysM peptidoglycan-binding domain-containing protein [Candidatus Nomurabacteria bacterium]|jgi:surface antigen|nr:LysM peptidoglycan-binding domain-containing protein [Candidatus Nomurabacteria bacterium]